MYKLLCNSAQSLLTKAKKKKEKQFELYRGSNVHFKHGNLGSQNSMRSCKDVYANLLFSIRLSKVNLNCAHIFMYMYAYPRL